MSLRSAPLLKELRRELLLAISGGDKRIADHDEIKAWILEKYQKNPVVGDMFRAILLIKEDLVVDTGRLPSLEESLRDISELERHSLPEFFFVSSNFDEKNRGILFQREHLNGGGLVFSATIFNQFDLISQVMRLEIRVSEKAPEPFIVFRAMSGWETVSKDRVHSDPVAIFVIQCLSSFYNYKYQSLPVSSLVPRKNQPRPNDYMANLITRAYRGGVVCTQVMVPLEIVCPRDVNYALKIPDGIINDYMQRLLEYATPESELLLYEKNGSLVMDDDYIPYLSYKALQRDYVPAVILGDFKQPRVKVLKVGGKELMPPVGVTPINQGPKKIRARSAPRFSNKSLLQEKISKLAISKTAKNALEDKFVTFCRLLGRSSTLEKDLHDFIKSNPQILDCHMAGLFSEVPIGRYRADLVLRYEQTDKRIVLIELERHADEIFTKADRLREKVTHASQQVEDWIGEIRANAPDIPEWIRGNYVVEGLVVIGRSGGLTKKQKSTLHTINSNRLVKIITYDDLLERMRRLINMLDDEA